MKTSCLWLFCLVSITVVFSSLTTAEAALGGSADSVAADRKALSAAKRATTSRNGYTVQEIESDATVVREYVSSSGVVFAIAWQGLMHPNLKALLGSYNREYQAALKQTSRRMGRRRQQVLTDQVVVEKWGHMRNLQGRAYAPALIPAGVTIDEIK